MIDAKDENLGGKNRRFVLSRRGFLQATGALGATAALAGGGLKLANQTTAKAIAADPKKIETFRSSCAMECLHCNLTAHVVDGKLVKVESSEDFHVKGCLRGLSRSEWVNHKDRLRYPMKRVGEKGEGKFEEISWDEALDEIVNKLKETKMELGNQGILFSAHAGNFSSLTNAVGSAFFDFFGGATRHGGQLCCQAVTEVMTPMLGTRYEDTRDTIPDSDYLLCWGNNPVVTMQSYFKDYEEAMSKGAKLVVIDPRFNETAAKAHEWVPIIPGTDTALALGMLKIMVEEDLHDKEFLHKHTGVPFLVDKQGDLVRADEEEETSYLVFDELSQRIVVHDTPNIVPALSVANTEHSDSYTTVYDLIVQEASQWDPKKVEEVTDIPADLVIRLGLDYAKANAAMIVANMGGPQRTEFGSYIVGAHFYLAAFSGNFGKAGGGYLDAGGVTNNFPAKPAVQAPKPIEGLPSIPVPELGRWVSEDRPNKIGFWWIMTFSAMTQGPNTNAMKAALKHVPFVVVVDNMMTSTALYADMVLPCCTIFEETNLMASSRSHYVQLMEKAVEPVGEAQSDLWIFTQLAKRLGFGEAFDKTPEEHIETILEGTGVTLADLKKGPVNPMEYPYIPYKDGIFKTPTQKAELYLKKWKDKGLSPVVKYYQVKESPLGSPDLAEKYPLMAVQRKLHRGIHSSFGTLPWIVESTGGHAKVMIHPNDAKKRGIKEGDYTVVYNHRGEHNAYAMVTTKIKEGVVCLENGWWEQQGGSSSYVTNDASEAVGPGHVCNSTLVNIRKGAK